MTPPKLPPPARRPSAPPPPIDGRRAVEAPPSRLVLCRARPPPHGLRLLPFRLLLAPRLSAARPGGFAAGLWAYAPKSLPASVQWTGGGGLRRRAPRSCGRSRHPRGEGGHHLPREAPVARGHLPQEQGPQDARPSGPPPPRRVWRILLRAAAQRERGGARRRRGARAPPPPPRLPPSAPHRRGGSLAPFGRRRAVAPAPPRLGPRCADGGPRPVHAERAGPFGRRRTGARRETLSGPSGVVGAPASGGAEGSRSGAGCAAAVPFAARGWPEERQRDEVDGLAEVLCRDAQSVSWRCRGAREGTVHLRRKRMTGSKPVRDPSRGPRPSGCAVGQARGALRLVGAGNPVATCAMKRAASGRERGEGSSGEYGTRAGRRRRTGADRAEDLDRPDVETMRAGPEGSRRSRRSRHPRSGAAGVAGGSRWYRQYRRGKGYTLGTRHPHPAIL